MSPIGLFVFCFFLLDAVNGILNGQKIGITELPFVVHGHCRALAAPWRAVQNNFVFTGMIVNLEKILTHCEYCGTTK